MRPPLQGRLLTQCLVALILVSAVLAIPYKRSRALPLCDEIPTCSIDERGAVKPFPPECTHFIYCDGEGNEIVSVCSSGLQFSPLLLYCTSPEEAMCPKCDVEPPTTTEEITTIAECPATPSCGVSNLGELLPYPSDCSQFIYCNGMGEGVVSICISGLHFSPTLGYCTYPEEALCPYCQVFTTPEVVITTTNIPPETTIGVCPPNPKCEPGDLGILKPYPEDCTKYLYCDENGEAEPSICEANGHFSPELLHCTNPEEAQCPMCYPLTTPQDTPTPTTETQTTTTPQDTPTPTTETQTTQPETTNQEDLTSLAPCPEILTCDMTSVGEMFPHPSECNKFFYCNEDGEGEESVCPPDLHYNPETTTCDTPELANCASCPTTTEVPTTITTLPVCEATFECTIFDLGLRKPYPLDCALYIYCDYFGVTKIRHCPVNLQFSPADLRCMAEDEAYCPSCVEGTTEQETSTTDQETSTTEVTATSQADCPPMPTCTVEERGVLKPYPPDCTMYVYCSEIGVAELAHCRAGTHFSAVEEHCMPEAEANCRECASVGNETTITEAESSTTDVETTEVSLTTVTCSLEPLPCVESGLEVPYPPDCTKYVYCDESLEPIMSMCPNGEHFSPTEVTCMSPEEANCPTCDFPSTTEIITTTTLPDCKPAPECPFGVEEGTILPYPENCSRYKYCLFDGSYKLRICRFGFQYAPLIGRCVPSTMSSCDLCEPIRTTTEEPLRTTTEEPYTTEDFTSSTAAACEPLQQCEIGDLGIRLPYPADCKNYMYCNGDATYQVRRCPSGQHFSPSELRCMLPDEAKCTFCVDTTVPPCVPTPGCSQIDNGLRKPYPPNCTKYLYCNFATPQIRTCISGQHFNPTNGKCEPEATAGCSLCSSESFYDFPLY